MFTIYMSSPRSGGQPRRSHKIHEVCAAADCTTAVVLRNIFEFTAGQPIHIHPQPTYTSGDTICFKYRKHWLLGLLYNGRIYSPDAEVALKAALRRCRVLGVARAIMQAS